MLQNMGSYQVYSLGLLCYIFLDCPPQATHGATPYETFPFHPCCSPKTQKKSNDIKVNPNDLVETYMF